MRRFLIVFSLVVLLPLIANAYTLVLKDGRRIEVKEKYRIVSDVVIFTLPEGNRFSISLDKINISATELANGVESGAFVRNTTEPEKITDKETTNKTAIVDEDPTLASRPTARKITNSDFEKYRVRREEMMKDVANRASTKAESTPPVSDPAAEKDAAFLAQRREREKNKETYWRGRSKALLTELRVQEEQIAALEGEVENSRRIQTPPNVSIYNAPAPYIYPGPGVRIGGIPIGIGGNVNSGSSVVVINQGQNNNGRSVQDRLMELRLRRQETIIRYQEMCEEARRDGALPGWLR
jgi:hypothetical protein